MSRRHDKIDLGRATIGVINAGDELALQLRPDRWWRRVLMWIFRPSVALALVRYTKARGALASLLPGK